MDLITTKKKSNFEKIQEWYTSNDGSVELSETVDAIRIRWSKAWSLLCNYHSPQQAANVMEKETGISIAQAYRDIRNSINLFGDINRTEKEGFRHIIYEFAVKNYQMAAKDKNIAEMNRAVANMIKLKGLDRDDPDVPDFSLLEIGKTEVTLPDGALELLMRMLESGVVDVSKFNMNAEDVDFKDVSDEEE